MTLKVQRLVIVLRVQQSTHPCRGSEQKIGFSRPVLERLLGGHSRFVYII